MRLGVYGGSFDPVHYGHLFLAECCREKCALDRVMFVPAAVSPHKRDSRPTEDAARVEMLQLAIGGHEAFELSTMELERGGVSYTVDTLNQLRDSYQGSDELELFFLMGADSLEQFSTWHKPDEICELATLIVVGRRGNAAPDLSQLKGIASDSRISEMQKLQFEMPLVEFSSSDIRRRVRERRSIRFQTPRAVEAYISSNGLYQP